MKYFAFLKPKEVSLKKVKNEGLQKIIEEAWHGGERTIVRSGDSAAAIVPLEDLAVLEDGEGELI